MSLVVKAWSQPIRPISKGGDVEKGGDVVRRSQKVGTSFGTSKRWGRRHKVGTSCKIEKGGDVATDCGDVPTFFPKIRAAASDPQAGRGGGAYGHASPQLHGGELGLRHSGPCRQLPQST